MKEIIAYVIGDDLPKVTNILRKHNTGGMVFYEVTGRWRGKYDEVPELVRSYMTGRKVIPEYAKRTKIESFVTDSAANKIVEEIISSIGSESEPRGMVFVREVSAAYEIGTNHSGDDVLSPRPS